MKKPTFNQFLDKKDRDTRKQLRIVRDLLSSAGLKVSDFIEHADEEIPFLFLHNPQSNASFKGVRIYRIGDCLAFRIQREAKTQPYGCAYSIKIPEMFNDLVEDHKEEVAGKKVIEGVVKEFQKFFLISAKAERDLQTSDIVGPGGDPMGRVVVQSTGTDYSNQVANSL